MISKAYLPGFKGGLNKSCAPVVAWASGGSTLVKADGRRLEAKPEFRPVSRATRKAPARLARIARG